MLTLYTGPLNKCTMLYKFCACWYVVLLNNLADGYNALHFVSLRASDQYFQSVKFLQICQNLGINQLI